MSYLDRLEDKLERVSRYSNYLLSLCPFHDDHNPSFFVYEDFYICKSCGKRGKPEDLLRTLDKSFKPRPVRINYQNPFTQWLREMDLIELCNRSTSLLKKLPHMGSYLHNRGLDQNLLKIVSVIDDNEKLHGNDIYGSTVVGGSEILIQTIEELFVFALITH